MGDPLGSPRVATLFFPVFSIYFVYWSLHIWRSIREAMFVGGALSIQYGLPCRTLGGAAGGCGETGPIVGVGVTFLSLLSSVRAYGRERQI